MAKGINGALQILFSVIVLLGAMSCDGTDDDETKTDSGIDSDADTDTDTDTDTDSDTDIDAGPDAGGDTDSSTDSETDTRYNCYDGVFFEEARIDLSDVDKELPMDDDTDHTIITECPAEMSVDSSPCLFYELGVSYYTGCCDGLEYLYRGVPNENRIEHYWCHIGCSSMGEVVVNGVVHNAHQCFN